MSRISPTRAKRAIVRYAASVFALALAAWTGTSSAMITVGPDAACQYHDLGSAIAAADQSPGVDLVAVATGTYTGVSTMFVNSSDDLIVEGGYLNCSAGISTANSTLDADGAANHGSLFAHFGAGHLTLRHLVLTHGDAGAGGGVDSEGSGALTLSDVMLYNNNADYGGGMFIGGNGPHKPVTFIGVQFNSNAARGSGGGLYVRDADVTIDNGGPTYFLGNFANGNFTDTGDGGGIYAYDANIVGRTHGVPGFPFVGSNIAHRNGGGIFYATRVGGAYELLLSNDDPLNPIEISQNAAVAGGGLYMDSYSADSQILSFAAFGNSIWRENTANDGAAVQIASIGNAFSVSTGVRFYQSRVGDAAPPCATGLRCNSLENNLAYAGYIVEAAGGGPTGTSSIELLRARMLDNSVVGGGGGLVFGGEGRVYVDGSLFAENTLDGDMMAVVSGDLHFANSTVAHNLFGAGQIFTAALVPSTVEILHSLLAQPNDPVDAYLVGTSIPVTVHDVGAENVTGLPTDPGNNVQFLTDPFVDAASGDFHIRTTSSAVDRWAATGSDPDDPAPTLDLDGALRPHVFNSTTTPYDFGAYEAGSVADAVFINGFD